MDFGGIRGWENQFHTAGGSAASHTFGRAHWWPVAGPIMVPPVSALGLPGKHRVEMTLNFKPGDRISILGLTNARLMIFGGEPMDGPRHIWWNFVSSRKERIEQAKADWKAGHFQKVPGDEIEFIPLPEK